MTTEMSTTTSSTLSRLLVYAHSACCLQTSFHSHPSFIHAVVCSALTVAACYIIHVTSPRPNQKSPRNWPKHGQFVIMLLLIPVDGGSTKAENAVYLLTMMIVQTILLLSTTSRTWHGMSKSSAAGVLQSCGRRSYAKTY